MCTTLSNNYNISSPLSACSGSYSGVTVNAKLTVEQGKTLTLTNPTWGNDAELEVTGELIIIKTTNQISGPIVVTDGGEMEVNGELIADGDVSLVNTSSLKVTNNFTCNGVFSGGYNCTLDCVSNAYFNYDVDFSGSGFIFNAANAQFAGSTGLTGKVTVTGTTTFSTNAVTAINCCMLKTWNLLNNAAANVMMGTTYIEVNHFFLGSNALTPDSTIQLYKAGGGGNVGSATVLGSKITPSPC